MIPARRKSPHRIWHNSAVLKAEEAVKSRLKDKLYGRRRNGRKEEIERGLCDRSQVPLYKQARIFAENAEGHPKQAEMRIPAKADSRSGHGGQPRSGAT
jgi:hypothetical protein